MKNNYITRKGWDNLKQELKFLWREERPKVTQAVSEAAALGDRSENAEYIYGKKRLREIDRRIRFLSKRLEVLKIVETDPRQEGRVYFGAWVKLQDKNGGIKVFRLVGPDEFNPAKKWISINSPVARELLGKQIDDEVTVNTPNGIITYWILDIGYWILDIGYWILDIGYWILDIGYWILDIGYWILEINYQGIEL